MLNSLRINAQTYTSIQWFILNLKNNYSIIWQTCKINVLSLKNFDFDNEHMENRYLLELF
jgi:hypothetical protein